MRIKIAKMLTRWVSLFYRLGLECTALERVKTLSGNNVPLIFNAKLPRRRLLANLLSAQRGFAGT